MDLSACHYCDTDGVAFLAKGCQLLEKNAAQTGEVDSTRPAAAGKPLPEKGAGQAPPKKRAGGGLVVEKLLIEGVNTSEQMMNKFTKEPYLLDKVPKEIATKLIQAADVFSSQSLGEGSTTPRRFSAVFDAISPAIQVIEAVPAVLSRTLSRSASKLVSTPGSSPTGKSTTGARLSLSESLKTELGTQQEGDFPCESRQSTSKSTTKLEEIKID